MKFVLKLFLKVLYFCAVIGILISGLRIDQGISKRTFEHVGRNINEGYSGETVYLEYETIDIDLFYHEVDLYYQTPKIYVQPSDAPVEVCLDDENDWINTNNISSVYLSDEIARNFDFGGVLILLAYVVFLILIPFKVMVRSAKNKRFAKAEAVRKNIDEYYNKCRSFKIYSVDKKDDQEKALLVAKNYGFTTLEEAIKNYHKGAEQAKTYKENKKKAKLAEEAKQNLKLKQEIEKKREEEHQKYIAEKKLGERTGRKRYISIVEEKIKELENECQKIKSINAFAPFMQHKKDNWGWVGGIAEGIAGPGAGAVAAMEARERTANYNNAVDKYNTNLINSGYDPIKIEEAKRKRLQPLEEEISLLSDYKKVIEKALINDDLTDADFNKIKFSVHGSVIADTLNLLLKVSVKVPEPTTILDHKAIIDGTVLIEVLDKKNQKIGEAYYVPYNPETYSLKEAGFNNAKTREVMAVPVNGKQFDENEKYHYTFKPVSLWLIETC